jgi:hypothetical protein
MLDAGAFSLPITIKLVKGHEYLYFSYYDRDERRKREVYLGPKKSIRAIRKALQYNKEFLNLQQCKMQTKYQRIDKYVNLLGKEADDRPIMPATLEA